MTTIVYKNGILAADSLICAGGSRVGEMKKVWKTRSGALVGFCGSASMASKIEYWVAQDLEGDVPDTQDKATIVLIRPDGQIYLVDDGGAPFAVAAPFIAEGSGSDAALGALLMGANAVRAVEVAIQVDISSGGAVQWVELGNAKVVPMRPKPKK